MLKPPRLQPRHAQRGMSLVELMVGVVVGLIIVAAATAMAASQLTENRRLLLETQVQQDMRATMELVSREIRRAGYNPDLSVVWTAGQPEREPTQNAYKGVNFLAADHIQIKYQRPFYSATCASPDVDYFLQGVVVMAQSCGVAEPITDPNAMEVTNLLFERMPANGTPLVEYLTCPKLCADGTENCWPTYTTYDIQITMDARSTVDRNNVQRRMVSRVRLRSDGITSGISATQLCPS